MSVSMWSYRPEVCDGGGCPGDCDLCDKPKNMEDEDDMTDYIKRDAVIDYLASNNMPWRDWVKDCRYWNHETDLTYCSKKVWLGTDATDYCSFGERAEA